MEVYLKELTILNQNGWNLVNILIHSIEGMTQNAKKSSYQFTYINLHKI